MGIAHGDTSPSDTHGRSHAYRSRCANGRAIPNPHPHRRTADHRP